MKILLLTTHLEMGGIPVYVELLARGLKQRGHIPMVASHGGWIQKRLHQAKIPHHTIPCRTSSELNPQLWFLALPKLLRLVRDEKPALLHAHTRVTQVLAWALFHLTGVPFVTTCHGLYQFRIGRRFFRCWGKWVMAISGPSMDRLVTQYKLALPHQVVLIRNGIELDRFLEPVPAEEVDRFRQTAGLKGRPVIGAIGRLSPVKGLDLFLKAVPGLLKSFPQLQVLLVGEGPAQGDLIRLSYQLGIEGHVIISHSVDDTRIPMAAMDLLAAPSRREGFGLAIVEAMAAGLPVVASNAGGPAEIIEDGKSGLLIPPEDPLVLGEAIARLLNHPAECARMVQAARQRVQEQFDMKRVVREVEAVYTSVVAAARGSRTTSDGLKGPSSVVAAARGSRTTSDGLKGPSSVVSRR